MRVQMMKAPSLLALLSLVVVETLAQVRHIPDGSRFGLFSVCSTSVPSVSQSLLRGALRFLSGPTCLYESIWSWLHQEPCRCFV